MFIKTPNSKIEFGYYNSGIDKIVIYENGKELATFESFEIRNEHPNTSGYLTWDTNKYITGEIAEIHLRNEIKNARKINLDRKDNFTVYYIPEYCTWEKRKCLYIHASEIKVTNSRLVLAMATEDEKNYLQAHDIIFNGVMRYYHSEKVLKEDIPNGAKYSDCFGSVENPCYHIIDTTKSLFANKKYPGENTVYIKKYITEMTQSNVSVTVCERYYKKTEYSEDRKRRIALAEKLNNARVMGNTHFSHYDIANIEKTLGYKLVSK